MLEISSKMPAHINKATIAYVRWTWQHGQAPYTCYTCSDRQMAPVQLTVNQISKEL